MDKNLNLLHFIYDHPENPWLGGGGTLRAFTVNKILARRGYSITMVCGNFPGKNRYEEKDGLKIHYAGSNISYLKSRITYGLCARRFIDDNAFDLVVDDTSAYTFSMPYLKSKRPRLAIVHHLFGAHTFKKNPVLGIVPFVFEKLNLRFYRYFIVGSPSVKEQVLSMRGPCVELAHIPYGINEILFDSNPAEGSYILFFGRIDIYNKGIDMLLNAFSQIKPKYPDLRLTFGGGGKDEKRLTELVRRSKYSKDIEFTGRCTEDQKRRLIENSIFLCMPSRFEGWGIVALEGAACSKAVVGTDIAGLRDAVLNNETGLLVPPDSPKALAQAMSRLLDDKALRLTLGRRGRERARDFQWEKIALKQEEFYLKVMASGYR